MPRRQFRVYHQNDAELQPRQQSAPAASASMPKNGISPARPSHKGARGIGIWRESDISVVTVVAGCDSTGSPRDRFRVACKSLILGRFDDFDGTSNGD
jgi:hypothetical protein